MAENKVTQAGVGDRSNRDTDESRLSSRQCRRRKINVLYFYILGLLEYYIIELFLYSFKIYICFFIIIHRATCGYET